MSRMLKEATGRCLCSAVTFVINGEVSSFHLCYCSRCRRSTASAHASNIFTQPNNIEWLSGKNHIQRYELATAKSWAKQFCKICGSGLPYINRSGTFLVVPAGSLDDDHDLVPDDRIFCQSRAAWIDGIETLTEFPQLPDKF